MHFNWNTDDMRVGVVETVAGGRDGDLELKQVRTHPRIPYSKTSISFYVGTLYKAVLDSFILHFFDCDCFT